MTMDYSPGGQTLQLLERPTSLKCVAWGVLIACGIACYSTPCCLHSTTYSALCMCHGAVCHRWAWFIACPSMFAHVHMRA